MRFTPLGPRMKAYYHLYFHTASTRPDLFESAPMEFAPSVRLTLVPTDQAHGPMAWAGVYELDLSRRMAVLARTGGLLMDVGANYGYFSCLWAALGAQNRVEAFEASPRNTAGLRRNVEQNGFQDRVRVVPCAAGRERGTLRFDLGPADQTGWGYLHRGTDGAEVDVVRLDDYCDEHRIAHIDVLKIDTEGADVWVLEGAQRLLAARRVTTVFFEEVPSHARRLGVEEGAGRRILEAAGYRVEPLAPDEYVATC